MLDPVSFTSHNKNVNSLNRPVSVSPSEPSAPPRQSSCHQSSSDVGAMAPATAAPLEGDPRGSGRKGSCTKGQAAASEKQINRIWLKRKEKQTL